MNLSWIPDFQATPPTTVYSDDCGMFIVEGRVVFDGNAWVLYDPVTFLEPNYRVDNENIRLMRWPPIQPATPYDDSNPPPKFLPPFFGYNAEPAML